MKTHKGKAAVSIILLAAVTALAGCAGDVALPKTGGGGVSYTNTSER